MLYGRDAERARIGELLEGARESQSGVLVIRGEPGVGKSALLEEARDHAPDMQVVSGGGIESEAELAFAALHQVVRPILGYVEHLPEPQARSLRTALGLEAGQGTDRFLVSLAVLSLLAEAAERQPLLCLIEDAHWLDDASADTLVFVARRLQAEPIMMLFTAREQEIRQFNASDLPELHLGALDSEAAGAMLDHRAGAALSREARLRLIKATGGNPLALLELPAILSEEQLTGAASSLDPLPVTARVERAFLARADRLPAEAQTLLLVTATDETGDLRTVLSAAARLGVAAEALDAVQETELLHVRGTTLEFHHPLVRSAVYQGAPASRRWAAHRALASVLEDESQADRRAWHRAAATVEPDASVVEELERAAVRARDRAGFAAASLALERAAALTADERDKVRRLTAAAENAWLGGQLDGADVLLEQARPLTSEPLQRADIDRYRGLIEMTGGTPADACKLLLRAAHEVAPTDGERALQMLNLASFAAVYAQDADAAVAIADAARRLPLDEAPIPSILVELLVGLGAHYAGDFVKAVPRLRLALKLAEQLDQGAGTEEPVALRFAGRAALHLGDDQAIYRIQHEAAIRARTGGMLGILTQILPVLSYAELSQGRWPSARADLSEGLRLAREIGQHDLVAYQLALLALLAAYRGDEHQCRSWAAESLELSSARRFTLAVQAAHWALTALELGVGRADEAYRHAEEIAPTGVGFWAALDRIDAAIRAGERETARRWLACFEPWPSNGAAPWARAVVLHCHALLSEDQPEAERLFEGALAAHADGGRPFEHARTELALGELLRRARRRVDAREHLRAALDGFERLGADPWAERARVELRASGQTARRRDPSTLDELTPQELQIAGLVAQGLSNREVAARLFLSPRTIDFHLRNVFRKLEITSRTQLANLDLDVGDANTPPAGSPAISPVRR